MFISKFINTCGSTNITLKAVDTENLKSDDPLTFQLSTDLDVGTIEACENEIVAGIFYNYNGGMTHVVPNAVLTNRLDTTQFVFQAIEDQGDDNMIVRKWGFFKLGQGDFFINAVDSIVGSPSINISVFGTIAVIYESVTLVEFGQEPGEFVIFEINGLTITAYGVQYPCSNIKIIGLIE